MHKKSHILKIIIGALFISISTISQAGVFSVTPLRVNFKSQEKALAITINNEDESELVMQAETYKWTQSPTGEDKLELTDDLLVAPPILKIDGKTRQVVRLAKLIKMPTDEQGTYRMIVREIPEALQKEKGVNVQFAFAFSIPIFITPPGLTENISCNLTEYNPQKLKIKCLNNGQIFVQPRNIKLIQDNKEIVNNDYGLYILPNVERTYELIQKNGTIPNKNGTLIVTLDHGKTYSFEISPN